MSTQAPSGSGQPRRRRGLDGRVIAARYQVTRTVAAGANTLIADALDTELDRQVTIKLVRPELSESESFRRHIRKQMEAVAAVSHPNLAAVYDWGEERIGKRTTVFVVGEYLSGGSLRDLFDRGRRLSPSQALMVGLEACRGLDYAHRQGLVHTELTPSKLVFGDDRRLRIVDFGLARILGEEVWKDPSQVPTHVARYASPEQALAGQPGVEREPIDDRTDVYSLALIMVEAVTGVLPFKGDSTVSTLSARIGRLMPVSADLGPLASVLERAGRPEPAERTTASQFGRALVRAAERMPRPQPIPILSAPVFEDTSALRRPNDPTGGIARPPASAEPALVEPSTAKPGDVTGEIIASSRDRTAGDTQTVDTQTGDTETVDTRTGDTDPGHTPTGGASADEATTDAGPGGTEHDSPGASSTPTGEPAASDEAGDGGRTPGSIDLAALVEATPARADAPTTAVRGSKRKQRRADRKASRAAERSADARSGAPEQPSSNAATPAAAVAVRADDSLALLPGPPAAAEAGKPRHRVLSFLFGLVLLGVLAGLGLVAWKLFRTPTHEVPAVAGLIEDDALDLVDDFKWDIDVQRTRSDEFETPGQVVRTAPAAGADLAEGSPLLLFVSDGPEYRQIPNVAGTTVDAATAELEAARLVVGSVTEAYDPSVPAGSVISFGIDGPLPEQGVLPGVAVNLVVSSGPQPIAVPNLVGRTPEQAQRLLDQFGLALVVGEPVFSNDIGSGLVATQDPAPDTDIVPGSSITVAASKGPDLVVMPDLAGLTVPQIRDALTSAGLVPGYLLGSTQGVFEKATVDGDDVEAGAQLLRGSTVDFFAFPPT